MRKIYTKIINYLNDLLDMCIAKKRVKDVRKGKSRTYTLEEVEKEIFKNSK